MAVLQGTISIYVFHLNTDGVDLYVVSINLMAILQGTIDVSHFNVDRLDLREALDDGTTILTANARLLVTTKRKFWGVDVVIVDVDYPSFYFTCDTERPTQVPAT